VENEVGGAFSDHDRRGVRVAADEIGHDRGVRHPQVLDAMQLEPLVDDTHALLSHAARPSRVIDRLGIFADERFQLLIALGAPPWQQLARDEIGERRAGMISRQIFTPRMRPTTSSGSCRKCGSTIGLSSGLALRSRTSPRDRGRSSPGSNEMPWPGKGALSKSPLIPAIT
jgi:hypothetical protein